MNILDYGTNVSGNVLKICHIFIAWNKVTLTILCTSIQLKTFCFPQSYFIFLLFFLFFRNLLIISVKKYNSETNEKFLLIFTVLFCFFVVLLVRIFVSLFYAFVFCSKCVIKNDPILWLSCCIK